MIWHFGKQNSTSYWELDEKIQPEVIYISLVCPKVTTSTYELINISFV